MAEIKDTLIADLKDAMRAKDQVKLRTIRSLKSAIMEREIALRTGGEAELTKEQEVEVLQKQAKRRRDSIEQYASAGREDLADKEREELIVIEGYLPEQLTDEKIRSVVDAIVADLGATSMKQMGAVMGKAMQAMKGQADGKRVQAAVKAALTGN
ncbi:MAG: GatB/YqeY domain-containing protein [Rhodothermales bacterium]